MACANMLFRSGFWLIAGFTLGGCMSGRSALQASQGSSWSASSAEGSPSLITAGAVSPAAAIASRSHANLLGPTIAGARAAASLRRVSVGNLGTAGAIGASLGPLAASASLTGKPAVSIAASAAPAASVGASVAAVSEPVNLKASARGRTKALKPPVNAVTNGLSTTVHQALGHHIGG